MSGGEPRWLLIGNSRWHWATADGATLRVDHSPPVAAPLPALHAWAAVGALPVDLDLPAERRLHVGDVPLAEAPPWLGIDRALAGWQAWRQQASPVLVADAGTVLSFTRVDAAGRFAGGRLMAGLALQLKAMAAATVALPPLVTPAAVGLPEDGWPAATESAMVAGVRRGLAAAVATAARDLLPLEPLTRLVVTGGDGALLLPLIREALRTDDLEPQLCPDLCLEALAALRPWPQARPRSARI